MVNSTDAIGRLIAEEVLLQSDRQLLRNKDQPDRHPGQKPSEPPAPAAPISHNDNAMASVLLTLLDEQLDAAIMNPRGPASQFPSSQSITAETAAGANRIAAQYAEADAVFRPDLPVERPTLMPDATNQQVLLAASSSELRIAMQSAFFSAAVRAQSDVAATSTGDKSRRSPSSVMNGLSLTKIGGAIFVVLALAAILAVGFAK